MNGANLSLPEPIELVAIDPARNIRRRYSITAMPRSFRHDRCGNPLGPDRRTRPSPAARLRRSRGGRPPHCRDPAAARHGRNPDRGTLRAGAYRGLSRHRQAGCLKKPAGATASMLPAQAAHPLLDDSPGDHRPTVALRILAGNGSAGQDVGGPLHVWRSPVSATAAMVMARSRRNGRSGKASRQIFSAIDASSCDVGGRASRMHAIKARGNRRSIVSLRSRYGSLIARAQPRSTGTGRSGP